MAREEQKNGDNTGKVEKGVALLPLRVLDRMELSSRRKQTGYSRVDLTHSSGRQKIECETQVEM